ncbi:MAG TPA: carbohydrate-binding family V/XII [Burkholderiales bacterium]|nr:carbohydrate-binding family V/XII [Burkholderiales bacterium]
MRGLLAGLMMVAAAVWAQTPPPPPPPPAPAPDVAWPRERKTDDGTTITVYQPQLERWADNNLSGRAAVSVVRPGEKEPHFGVIELAARTDIDKNADLVTLSQVRITKGAFPGVSPQDAEKYLATLRAALPKTGWPVSAQALQANLAIAQAQSKQKALPVKNNPPQILFRTSPSMLVPVDGEPALRDLKEAPGLKRVINTGALILQDPSSATYYLWAVGRWFEAKALTGEWKPGPLTLAQLDKARAALANQYDPMEGKDSEDKPLFDPGAVPQIIVTTKPTELLQSKGEPKFSPIPGTQLLYMANSSNDIFMELGGQAYYVLISGRWFSAKTLTGPWTFINSKKLPADFAKIPPEHPMSDVLMSVAGTPQAGEAAIANQIPQTASVQRDIQPTPVVYDGGKPQWKPIEGTPLQYAFNTGPPVIQIDPKTYYMVQNGVWFAGTAATGPWAVTATVPTVIYTIPASSPLHYVTYVRVYSSTPTTVFVGYTPGYYGTVMTTDGTVVYGTGYVYPVYVGAVYYPPPPTYGWGAGFATGVFFGFAISGGWHSPCCYGGGGGVYINHRNTNININNSYNRWGGKTSNVSGPGGRDVTRTQVGNTTLAKGSGSNNVYAGRDGQVYRNEGGNWQKYEGGAGKGQGGGTWSDVQRPEGGNRPDAGTRPSQQPAGGSRPGGESVNSLDRQAQARQTGEQRATAARQPSGGFQGGGGGFSGGGGARGGGGGRGGGGRR